MRYLDNSIVHGILIIILFSIKSASPNQVRFPYPLAIWSPMRCRKTQPYGSLHTLIAAVTIHIQISEDEQSIDLLPNDAAQVIEQHRALLHPDEEVQPQVNVPVELSKLKSGKCSPCELR